MHDSRAMDVVVLVSISVAFVSSSKRKAIDPSDRDSNSDVLCPSVEQSTTVRFAKGDRNGVLLVMETDRHI